MKSLTESILSTSSVGLEQQKKKIREIIDKKHNINFNGNCIDIKCDLILFFGRDFGVSAFIGQFPIIADSMFKNCYELISPDDTLDLFELLDNFPIVNKIKIKKIVCILSHYDTTRYAKYNFLEHVVSVLSNKKIDVVVDNISIRNNDGEKLTYCAEFFEIINNLHIKNVVEIATQGSLRIKYLNTTSETINFLSELCATQKLKGIPVMFNAISSLTYNYDYILDVLNGSKKICCDIVLPSINKVSHHLLNDLYQNINKQHSKLFIKLKDKKLHEVIWDNENNCTKIN